MLLVLAGATSAFASGGSGGGGGGGGGGVATGGGGGGGGSASGCTGPTSLVVANSADGIQVAPYWQPNATYYGLASGKASKDCDSLPVIIHFTDSVVTGDPACVAQIGDYRNPLYFKYGVKPPSRYESLFLYSTGSDCVGVTHSLTATMVNNTTGAVLGSSTTTWISA